MKVVILAGGLGTRMAEETSIKPKPMVEIGGMPIIWHIMKSYSHFGFNDFIICGGYKAYQIKEYFSNYFLHKSNVTFDLQNNLMEIHNNQSEPWKVTIVDTGINTMTGGRIKRIEEFVDNQTFMMTYGDGLSNVDLAELKAFHKNHNKLATVTAVRPSGRFGAVTLDGNDVIDFDEKPVGDGGFINGGFFVLEPKIFSYIDGDQSIWERAPLNKLVEDKQLSAYKHEDFWQPMDTLREKNLLEDLWATGKAPWKLWDQ